MLEVKCINKVRNTSNNIVMYSLIDKNGERRNLQPSTLKEYIRKKKIYVRNLALTSDNRLVDKKEMSYSEYSKSQRYIKVANIAWDVSYEDLYEVVAEAAEKSGNVDLDIDGYVDDLLRHNMEEVNKLMGLPSVLTIKNPPKSLYVDINGDAENLSDYLSNTYGFTHRGFRVVKYAK